MRAIGIDIGTTNTKACLIAGDVPRLVAKASRPTSADVGELQNDVLALTADCLSGHPGEVAAVGISSMAETGTALDASLRPLRPLISWRDQPGREQAGELARELDAQDLYARTGLRLSAKLPLVTWRWLRDAEPSTFAAMRVWAGAADLAVLALTGAVVTDPTLAGRTGAYSLADRGYDPDLLRLAGVPVERLPAVAGALTPAGTVTTAAAAATGLRAGTPVVVAGHDHLVAAWAAGVREPGQVADSMGTAEAIITPTGSPEPGDALRRDGVSVGWYVDGRHGVGISGHGASGGLVEQRLTQLADGDYDWLAAVLAGRADPSAEVLAPYPSGRQAPRPDPRARFDPEEPAADPAAAMRALVDALSLHARWMAESQTALIGCGWTGTVAFGGPVRSDGWMRRKALADAGPESRSFAVVPGTSTAAAGAALIALTAIGADPAPLPAEPVFVDAALARTWDEHFWQRFHRLVAG